MKRLVAGILLFVYVGFSFVPNFLFLRLHLLEDKTAAYQEEKLPSLRAQDAPLTGDYTYLLAIKERLLASKHSKKDTNIPHNYFDFSGVLFFIPANIHLTVQAGMATQFYWYQRTYFNLYREVNTPPPKQNA